LVRESRLATNPAVHCVQPVGNNTIAGPLRDGQQQGQEVTCTSEISGLQVPNVIDGDLVIQECRPTGGTGHLVSDQAVWAAQSRLATDEGIFTEPAGAVALAGIIQAAEQGHLNREARIVCLVTGIGFKDEASIERMIADAECPLLPLDQLRDI
jgi:threonine synthase